MSVPKGDRGKSKLDVLQLSLQVSRTMIRACKNEKYFPKSTRWVFAKRIIDECVDAVICIRRANAVFMSDAMTEADYAYRRSLQVQAHTHYEALLGLLDMVQEVHNIPGDRIEYWVGMIVEADDLLKEWIKSDSERVKRFL